MVPSIPVQRRTPSESDRTSAGLLLDGSLSTHCCQRRLSHRPTGPPWNLTFADGAEKVRDTDSGHSEVAIIDSGKVPAERLHPKAAYSRCRP